MERRGHHKWIGPKRVFLLFAHTPFEQLLNEEFLPDADSNRRAL
jgi:hypothetical protein